MNTRLVFVLAIGVAALLAWSPVAAQENDLSEDERALVTFVQAAFENLNTQGSYRMQTEQTGSQSMMVEAEGAMEQSVSGNVDMQIGLNDEGDLTTMSGSTTSRIEMGMMEGIEGMEGLVMGMTADVLLVDDQYFMRINLEDEGFGFSQMFEFGDGWYVITLDDLIAQYENIPALKTSTFSNCSKPAEPTLKIHRCQSTRRPSKPSRSLNRNRWTASRCASS